MVLKIANPVVVAKVERLARATGLTKTAVIERAIDALASQTRSAAAPGPMAALLAQLDRVPDCADAHDPALRGPAGKARRALLEAARKSGAAKAKAGPNAARSQDFLYGDDGLPE